MQIGFIGTGKMGATLVKAATASVSPSLIFISNRSTEKAEKLALTLGVNYSSNDKIAEKCEYIVLGIKPQMYAAVLKELAPVFRQRKDRFVIISMAAGVSINTIRKILGESYPVIRIMPNTPAILGEGMIPYSTDKYVKEDEKRAFLDTFKAAGKFDEIPENLMDAAGAVSGCGPAFVYMFAEALADGGVKSGLPREKANMYAAQMLKGAAEMLLESGDHPGKLKDDVCSPGGSTIVGVSALENGGFRASVINAVYDAYKKTVDLGK